MSFNGSGEFQRIHSWTTDKANEIPITASRQDTEDDGFATGLSNTICRDGQSTIIANIPFNDKKITGLGDATAATDALNRQTGDGRYARLSTSNTFTANLTVDNDSGARYIVSGAAETVRGISFRTAGSSRWRLAADSTAESGSSAGSDLQLHRWSDGGFVSTAVFTVARATGVLDFGSTPTVSDDDIYHQGNTVGTVSQSSGDPTGAVIEKGSNANGEYVRYADGTQFCWHNQAPSSDMDTSSGNVFRSDSELWTYPASFSGGSFGFVCGFRDVSTSAPFPWGATVQTFNASMTFVLYSSTSTTASVKATLFGSGRWF